MEAVCCHETLVQIYQIHNITLKSSAVNIKRLLRFTRCSCMFERFPSLRIKSINYASCFVEYSLKLLEKSEKYFA
jgi:hypothetical protein